jgi:arylsulfatase A-like enzyme
MSDNGSGGGGGRGRGRRGGLSGGKGSVWEGGIRSPLIIRGPGVPADSWCHTRVVGYDFYPTYCQWAGVPTSKLPPDLEGGSIAGLLASGEGEVKRSHQEMVFHFPHYQSGDGPHSALFLGNFKLIKFYENNRRALFDISKDISEQNDLAEQMPQKTAELDRLLVRYLHDIDAQMAVPNPQYDPDRAPTARQRAGGNTRTDAVLAVIDLNGDGQLSASELRAIPDALRERDADGDGAVTIQEIQSRQPGRNRNGN